MENIELKYGLPPLPTRKQAMSFLQCSSGHLYKLVEEGKIRVTHIGKSVRINREDLIALGGLSDA